ncbi:MAG: rRNA adenine N-6-methyltransferase family protein, partial [Candidatus Micrarchaeota archaeon]
MKTSAFGITPRKKLSQTFLVDERVLAREVEYARVRGKEVLEIGAGTGNLTERLALGGARRIIAVEKDKRLIETLHERLRAHSNVIIVHADFLDYEIEKTDVIVSNVPYS